MRGMRWIVVVVVGVCDRVQGCPGSAGDGCCGCVVLGLEHKVQQG